MKTMNRSMFLAIFAGLFLAGAPMSAGDKQKETKNEKSVAWNRTKEFAKWLVPTSILGYTAITSNFCWNITTGCIKFNEEKVLKKSILEFIKWINENKNHLPQSTVENIRTEFFSFEKIKNMLKNNDLYQNWSESGLGWGRINSRNILDKPSRDFMNQASSRIHGIESSDWQITLQKDAAFANKVIFYTALIAGGLYTTYKFSSWMCQYYQNKKNKKDEQTT